LPQVDFFEMEAIAWATLGVLSAAVFGMFAALVSMNGSLNGRIDVLTDLVDHLRPTAG
jgi:hypothetical protein